jgi:hypothetical protein
MSLQTAARSRRAVLTAAAGAVGAAAIQAIAKPLEADATINHEVLVNDETAATVLEVSSNQQSGFPNSGKGTAISAFSSTGTGINAVSGIGGIGVSGLSGSDGYGVYGNGGAAGVYGTVEDFRTDSFGVQGVRSRDVDGNVTGGAGVYGENEDGDGIHGVSSGGGGTGVKGEGTFGVLGISATTGGFGVWGQHTSSGPGVNGDSNSGPGVHGKSTSGYGGVFEGGKAQLRLKPSSAATHPPSGALGDLFLDKNKRLWFCKGGTTWKQLA